MGSFFVRQASDETTCSCTDPDICTCSTFCTRQAQDTVPCICTYPDICTCSSISEHQMPDETTCSCTDPDICACILRTDIIPTLLAEIRLAGQLYQEQLEDQAKLDVKVLDHQVADMGRLPSQSTENGESSIPEDPSSENSLLLRLEREEAERRVVLTSSIPEGSSSENLVLLNMERDEPE